MADSTLLEQYKALIGDVGNIGTRYATANGFYLSIVSALLGVVAFTESGKPLAQVDLVLVLTVAAFAIVVRHVWMKTLAFYRGLFGVKLQLLGEMEKELAFRHVRRKGGLANVALDPDQDVGRRAGGRNPAEPAREFEWNARLGQGRHLGQRCRARRAAHSQGVQPAGPDVRQDAGERHER